MVEHVKTFALPNGKTFSVHVPIELTTQEARDIAMVLFGYISSFLKSDNEIVKVEDE